MADREVILVTGSSGLIGSALIDRIPEGSSIVGFDRDGPPYPPVKAECVCIDLTSDKNISRAMERVRYAYGNRIASFIHLDRCFTLAFAWRYWGHYRE